MGELILELLVGLALMALGFGVLWLIMGERALDYSGTDAWGVGFLLVTLGSGAFLATREILQKRRAEQEKRRR